MKELFQPRRNGEHSLYTRLRDWADPYSAQRREFFIALWRQYSQLAPKSFPKKLQIEFHQRWWEMYLTVGMLHLDLSPTCSKSDSGPDFSIDISGQRIFVEATAPSSGTKSDRVPDERVQNGVFDFPEQQCLLRLTQAFSDKCARLQDYIRKGVIPANACTIIAISASDLNQYGTTLEGFLHPAPLSFLAGAGRPVLTNDANRPIYFNRRSNLQRDSGSKVDAAPFYNPDYSFISGVLYSSVDLWNAPQHPEMEISLFVNPLAHPPIPDAFRDKFVHWVKDNSSESEDVWRKVHPDSVR